MDDLLTDLTLGYRMLGLHGIGLGVLAHLTVREPGASTFWTYQLGQSVEEVCRSDLREVDFSLQPVRGEAVINPSLSLHGEIYAARPDVVSIAHHHGDNAVALGAIGQNVVPFDRNAARWANRIELDEDHDHLPVDERGPATVSALAKNKGLLLKHHGVLVTGECVQDAVVSTVELERTCGVQLKAMAAGSVQPMDNVGIEDVEVLMSKRYYMATWAYYRRSLSRHGLDRDLD